MVLAALAAALGLGAAAHAAAASPAATPPPPAAQPVTPPGPPISVQDGRLSIDMEGNLFDLEARAYRPPGRGPFPVVLIHHGAPTDLAEAGAQQPGFAAAARWFAARGYVVIVAMRPGFGDSQGPNLEPVGTCDDGRDYAREAQETADVEAAMARAVAALPGVDGSRIVVVGHASGGFGALAMADDPPPGVLGVIDFAGGRSGGDQETICGGPFRLVAAAGALGRANQLPQLWLFAANDHVVPPGIAHALDRSYQAGSKPKVTFVDLPAVPGDGHALLDAGDPAVWAAPVGAFLREIGAEPAPR